MECEPYQLVVRHLASTVQVQIMDRTHNQLACWEGGIVRELLATRALPRCFAREGNYPCGKAMVWHLILCATAASLALNRIELAGAVIH